MLAITYRSRPSMMNGLRSSSVILSATRTACVGSSTASMSTTNSAPEASQGILRAQAAPEALGYDRKEEVSHLVTEGVVYDLEVVQVHEQHGDLACATSWCASRPARGGP